MVEADEPRKKKYPNCIDIGYIGGDHNKLVMVVRHYMLNMYSEGETGKGRRALCAHHILRWCDVLDR